ncbi:MAG: aminopeptidase P family protein [Phycisphaeraceae bacterium]|nr:aminopeptidase P family protein [Phycisphaeraceae bacterium]
MPKPAKATPRATDTGPHHDRIRALKARLKKAGHEAFLITNPTDVAYLTGFLGGDSYLLLLPRAAVIISDSRYREELASVEHLARIQMRQGSLAETCALILAAAQPSTCAVQSESMTLAEHAGISNFLGKSRTQLVPVKGLVSPLRAIKDQGEIATIRRAARIQEQALLALLPLIKPGMSELEIAGRLELEMKTRGSSEPAFKSIVAAGPASSHPHYRPSTARLKKGQILLIDWGATLNGYRSDMTRTFAFGRWPKALAEVYDIVLEAHQRAASLLAPGRSTREIDAAARDFIASKGFGDKFGHGLGHGIGLNVHEEPSLSHVASPTTLTPGHIVTIEPGIYLPGIGGIRLENDYLITDRGAKNLCTLPLDRTWATL